MKFNVSPIKKVFIGTRLCSFITCCLLLHYNGRGGIGLPSLWYLLPSPSQKKSMLTPRTSLEHFSVLPVAPRFSEVVHCFAKYRLKLDRCPPWGSVVQSYILTLGWARRQSNKALAHRTHWNGSTGQARYRPVAQLRSLPRLLQPVLGRATGRKRELQRIWRGTDD